MVRIAAVFAGQGAQVPGMGRSFYDASPAARAVFEAAGGRIMHDCFEATQEELNQTDVTQPAVYTVDMAAWAAFLEATAALPDGAGIDIVGVAGFSLGEYAAFTAAGVIPDIAAGIALIRERGRLMAAAGKHADGAPRGAMAAVLGAAADILPLVEEARGSRVLEAVNFNAPTQTVVAGDAEAIEAFAEAAKASGTKLRVMPLPVSTAFPSPIMAPASEGIRATASQIAFGQPRYEVYLDMTGGTLTEYCASCAIAGAIPGIMAEQVHRPVLWQRITERLAADGADAIVEFGPGKTLTGLAKKTVPGVPTASVQDEETLAEALDALGGMKGR
jgi:[acyl-carrier-protein] S-malonyltransferase